MKIRNEFKIGIWAIIALVLFIWGMNYLKGINMLREGQFFYVTSDRVDGLAVSSHVKLNGLKVGVVRSMEYDAANRRAVILINIEDDNLRIPRDSHVSVKSELLGTSDIVLQMGESNDCYQPWDTIYTPGMEPSLMDAACPIVDQVSALMPKIDSLVSGMNVLINESRLHESLLEVHSLTVRLNQTVLQLNNLLSHQVPAIMSNVEDATANIDTLTLQLRQADIEQLIANANNAVVRADELLQNMQSDSTTVGRLLTTDELHQQLTQTIADVDSLINDIKQNPKRYIHIKVF